MMWEEAARKVQAFGGELRMGRTVEKLQYDETGKLWTVTAKRGDGEIKYSRRAMCCLRRHARVDAHRAKAAQPVQRPRSRISRLPDRGADRSSAKELPDNWVYIHDPSVKVGRVQNFRSWSPEIIADGVSPAFG